MPNVKGICKQQIKWDSKDRIPLPKGKKNVMGKEETILGTKIYSLYVFGS